MGGCDSLENFYDWEGLGVGRCDWMCVWVWVGVTDCGFGWVGG